MGKNTAGLYHEPPPEEIHLYEQRADSKWYWKDEPSIDRSIPSMTSMPDRGPSDSEYVFVPGQPMIVDNPKYVQALKDGKDPLEYLVLSVFPGDAIVLKLGAIKYGIRNWLKDKIKVSTYVAAILRHVTAWALGQDIDPESGQHHLYHVRACCAIVLDSQMNDMLIDDREAK